MKPILFTLIIMFCLGLRSFGQVEIQWQRCLGGTGTDNSGYIAQCNDGGYIIASSTISNNGDVSGNNGFIDFWIVKTNSTCDIEWQHCIGGSGSDFPKSIIQTNDGGYIVVGDTDSNNGDVSGNSGNYDIWVVKLDAQGEIEWQRCLGGTLDESANSVIQTTDYGYIVLGHTYSNNIQVTENHGINDMWVIKLNQTGSLDWQKCLGGSSADAGYSVIQDTDSSYVLAGFTSSNDGDVSGYHDNGDAWIVNIDLLGKINWQECFGGSFSENAFSIKRTYDNGYIFTGKTRSNDGNVSGNHGLDDIWIVKLDSLGEIEWQKCIGGTIGEIGYTIIQTTDSCFVIAGYTDSNNGDVSGNHNGTDFWIIKINWLGEIEWQKCLGGTNNEEPMMLINTPDGGYILSGSTNSDDGDVNGNHGNGDVWIVKILNTNNLEENFTDDPVNLLSYPNPVKSSLKVYLPENTNNMSVYNLNGELVQQFIPHTQVAEINVKDLNKGFYIVKIYYNKGILTKRFVKE